MKRSWLATILLVLAVSRSLAQVKDFPHRLFDAVPAGNWVYSATANLNRAGFSIGFAVHETGGGFRPNSRIEFADQLAALIVRKDGPGRSEFQWTDHSPNEGAARAAAGAWDRLTKEFAPEIRWVISEPFVSSREGSGVSHARVSGLQRKPVAVRAVFEHELAAARREGLSVSARDLMMPLPPSAENAATYYIALGRSPINEADWLAIEILYIRVNPIPAEIERARRLLAVHKSSLDLVHRAVGCKRCVFPRDWMEWPTDNPPTAPMRYAARWLAAESALEWLDGKRIKAVQTLALCFQIARHAAADRSLIAWLVANAVRAITLGSLRLILLRGGDQPGVAQAVRAAIERESRQPSLVRVMGGELASGVGVLGVDPEDPSHDYMRLNWKYGFFKQTRAISRLTAKDRKDWQEVLAVAANDVRFYRSAIPLMDLPYPLARARINHAIHSVKPAVLQPDTNFNDISGQTCLSALSARVRSQALYATVEAGAVMLEYAAKHGSLPRSLDSAITPVPLDPYDLKPLRYRREGKGFVVYSVGESGKFDGGRPEVEPTRREPVFRWPRPAWAR